MTYAPVALMLALWRMLRVIWSAICGHYAAGQGSSRSPHRSRARQEKANAGPTARSPDAKAVAAGDDRGTKARASSAVKRGRASAKPSGSTKPLSSAKIIDLGSPKAEIKAAVSAAMAAQNCVEHASDARLAELLLKSARERLDHLRDPALTAADRRRLRGSIDKELPRRSVQKGRRDILENVRWFRRRWRVVAVALVLASVCAGFAAVAWRNTGARFVVSGETWAVIWALPDGRRLVGAWRAGYPAIAMRPRDGNVVLRYWLKGFGYAETTLPEWWLVSHIPPALPLPSSK